MQNVDRLDKNSINKLKANMWNMENTKSFKARRQEPKVNRASRQYSISFRTSLKMFLAKTPKYIWVFSYLISQGFEASAYDEIFRQQMVEESSNVISFSFGNTFDLL